MITLALDALRAPLIAVVTFVLVRVVDWCERREARR